MLNTIQTRVFVVMLVLGIGCGGSSDSAFGDFVATAETFTCLTEQARLRNLRIANPLGYLDEAVALPQNPQVGKEYPLGTILQLVPGDV
jgi:hypothetical protein